MWAMVILKVLGIGVQAGGTLLKGRYAREEAMYNAKVLEQQAQLTRQAEEVETERLTKEARRVKSTQRAGFGAAGAIVSEGTPLMVLAEQAGSMQMDILQNRRTRFLEQQALLSKAKMMKRRAKQLTRLSHVEAAGGVLQGTSGLAGMMGSSK